MIARASGELGEERPVTRREDDPPDRPEPHREGPPAEEGNGGNCKSGCSVESG